eukprot:Skav212050  [mRNA]  locus=scaffold408:19851:22066:+ [translate_table: standard]
MIQYTDSGLDSRLLFVEYDSWLGHYEILKEFGAVADCIEFCDAHPGAVNNRKLNLQGNTMLHQLAFWGFDNSRVAGVVERFKQLGADPSLRNYEGKNAIEMAESQGHNGTAEVIRSVFDFDHFGQHKAELLTHAHRGDFGRVVKILKEKPHLRHLQGNRGWSVLHQAAFHRCSSSLLARLMDVYEVGADLKTHDGETAKDILRQQDPHHPYLAVVGGPPAPLRVGCKVVVAPSSEQGRLQSFDDDGRVSIALDTGATQLFERWCLQRLPDATESPSGQETMCCICTEEVPPRWKLGCEHLMCGECRIAWMWSQYNVAALPLRCSFCEEVCPLEVPEGMGRAITHYWEQMKQSFGTEMTFPAFMRALASRLEELGDVETRVSYVWQLVSAPHPPVTIAYCDVRAPAMRACPHCGVVIAYLSDCKHMCCASCGRSFCWLCLRSENEHQGADWNITIGCAVAPTQSEQQIRSILERRDSRHQ